MRKVKNLILVFLCALFISLNANSNTYTMKATYYMPGKGCGWVTASGDRINYNKLKNFQIRWVALSPDMFNKHGFKLGDVIEVITDEKELAGTWIVKDKSAPSNKNHIDFLFASPAKFGSCKVEIRKKKGKKRQDEEVVSDSIDNKVKKAFGLI